jgi:hypothetical protein
MSLAYIEILSWLGRLGNEAHLPTGIFGLNKSQYITHKVLGTVE